MPCNTGRGAAGSPSRFIYCAKVSRADRGPGNEHVTCKSTTLMAWLCRLITPPGGTILDSFMGSGSTGVAALREGFDFTGIESDPESFATAEQRIAAAVVAMPLFPATA
jgi:DNA modification methylase